MAAGNKVFITGATGYIGTILLQKLVARGESIRALSRRDKPKPPPEVIYHNGGPLCHANVEVVRGDIGDIESLRRGMRGCNRVFHLAAYAKNWARDPATFYEMNVQGVRNVFDAAAEVGVERIVLTSSCVTLGPSPPGGVLDEDTPRITDRYLTSYEETKSLAEAEAIERSRKGLPVVIVNPTRIYGPGPMTEGNTGSRLIDDYIRGRMPFLLNFGRNVGNWVFVDDVAEGHLLAMERGRIGQRYLLGGENASLKQFFREVATVTGKHRLQIPLKNVIPLAFAWIQKKRAEWFDVYPEITPGWVRTYCLDWAYRSDKAINELGYRPTPLGEGIRKTYAWLKQVQEEGRR